MSGLYLLPLIFLAVFDTTRQKKQITVSFDGTSDSTVRKIRTTALAVNKAYNNSHSNDIHTEETDTFLERITKSGIFVDKTLLIEKLAFADEFQTYLITFPGRWGKTYNLQMVKQFLEIPPDISTRPINETESQQLFQSGKVFRDGECIIHLENPLIISKHPDFFKHQGQYPVIFLNFLIVGGSSHEDFIQRFQVVVLMAFQDHANSLAKFLTQLNQEKTLFEDDVHKYKDFIDRIKQPRISSEEDLQKSIFILSHCLFLVHKQKVFVLIDEYDAPITDVMTSKHYLNKDTTLEFYHGFMSLTFENNQFLKHGILTGIFQISEIISLMKGFIQEHSILGTPLQNFYGLTEQEVLDLLTHIGEQEQINSIKKWYEGYRNINNTIVTYNVWSIFTYIKERKFGTHWINTGIATKCIFKELLNISITEDLFTTILIGEEYFTVVDNFRFTKEDFYMLLMHQDKDLMFSEELAIAQNLIKFLLSTGFLTATANMMEGESKMKIGVVIPSNEVREEFTEILKDYFTRKFLLEDEEEYNTLSIDIVKNLCSFAISEDETSDTLTKSIECYVNNLINENLHTHPDKLPDKIKKIFQSLMNSIMITPGNRRTLHKFETESHDFANAKNYTFVHKNHGIIVHFQFHDPKYPESGPLEQAMKQLMDSAHIFQHEKKVKKIKLICVNTFLNKTIQILGKKIDNAKK